MTNTEFVNELTSLLNRACRENDSNTPDYVLAEYLMSTLDAYDTAVSKRDEWHGRATQPTAPSAPTAPPVSRDFGPCPRCRQPRVGLDALGYHDCTPSAPSACAPTCILVPGHSGTCIFITRTTNAARSPTVPATCATCGGTGKLMDSGPPDHWSAPCPDCAAGR